ncbi:MAG TPA: peptide MFS transporter [Chitinophagaceae bacterium]|jgi:POT family proton-dependent oligopeptide transporter|nr:peptide MFS transporter [Chitinophagaceae bacterium]
MSQTYTIRKGHPRGLYVLFFTEMWERFGFYLMIGILLLYLRDTVPNGGRGMDNALAIDIVGSYVALVYLTPFIGGLIADRYLGYGKSIIIGGSLMALGYFLLAVHGSDALLYFALFCIIVGNGFFKPNISTLLGNVYNTEELKPKKDSAYNIFYMGINIGAFFCNFVAAYLRNNYGWGYAFAAAGVGMLLGIVIFLIGRKHVTHADIIKPVQKEDMPISRITLFVFIPAIIAGLIGWFIPGNLIGSDSNDAFIAACIPIIVFYFSILRAANPFDKRRISTLLTMFAVAILFWNIYNQNSTALTIWADNYTHREMPAGAEKFLETFDLAQTVSTNETQVPVLDEHFRTRLGADGKVVTAPGVDPYFKNLPKSEWPAEGQDLKLVSTEMYQSINPFWIILLTPVIVGFFGWLRSRRKEPSTPAKIAWGIIIAGISSVVMILACLSTDIYHDKVSSAWIFASYGVFTISELFLSPIGLSLVSKVAPRRLTSLMMGGWFLTTSIGGKISGILAGFWDNFDNKAIFFTISAAAAIIAGVALFPLVKKLSKVVDEATAAND